MRSPAARTYRTAAIHAQQAAERADISITVEEGRKYHLNNITFTGVKFFRTPEALMTPCFGMAKGDVFSTAKLRKGIENMRKLYGEFGYIDFVVGTVLRARSRTPTRSI